MDIFKSSRGERQLAEQVPTSPHFPLLTRAEAAELLRVTPRTVCRLETRGILRGIRRPGLLKVMYSRDHVEKLAGFDQAESRNIHSGR